MDFVAGTDDHVMKLADALLDTLTTQKHSAAVKALNDVSDFILDCNDSYTFVRLLICSHAWICAFVRGRWCSCNCGRQFLRVFVM